MMGATVEDMFNNVVHVIANFIMPDEQARPTRWPWWFASGLVDWISLAVIERETNFSPYPPFFNPPYGIQLESTRTDMEGCSTSLELLSVLATRK